jgi:hypothetical protein
MIVQMTRTRDECFLIKELLPIWKKYADGFVFISDNSTDDTLEFLHKNKEKYNILEILETNSKVDMREYETDARQKLFDTAYKYSNKIICLDTDEYLDGKATKKHLEKILDQYQNTVLMLKWIQYTGKNQRRVDSFWDNSYHDRVGTYNFNAKFGTTFSHSSHMPGPCNGIRVDPEHLFIAHLQWLDKKWVGVKQYFWKVWDYANHKEHGVQIIDCRDYDVSVNSFNWKYQDFEVPLKIDENIYSTQDLKNNYKLKFIAEKTKQHNIPNLNDWGLGIYDYCLKS